MNNIFMITVLITMLSQSLAVGQVAEINPSPGKSFALDFNKLSPKDLILFLKNNRKKVDGKNILSFMDRAPAGWVKKSDLSFLMEQIHSADTCSCLISPLSSQACLRCWSTIGGHAAEMIESYRSNTGYPASFYNCPLVATDKIKELDLWWKNFRN
jgi:hypothetical protein